MFDIVANVTHTLTDSADFEIAWPNGFNSDLLALVSQGVSGLARDPFFINLSPLAEDFGTGVWLYDEMRECPEGDGSFIYREWLFTLENLDPLIEHVVTMGTWAAGRIDHTFLVKCLLQDPGWTKKRFIFDMTDHASGHALEISVSYE